MKEIFEGIASKVRENPAKVAGLNAVFQFELSGEGGGNYYVAVSGGTAEVHEGSAENPGVTLQISAADFKDLVAGKLNGMAAFMSGKLKVKGDMGLAMRLQSVLS